MATLAGNNIYFLRSWLHIQRISSFRRNLFSLFYYGIFSFLFIKFDINFQFHNFTVLLQR